MPRRSSRRKSSWDIAYVIFIVLLVLQLSLDAHQQRTESPESHPLKRFEYKYSFKPPYLAQKDGSVPFFIYSGNAIASQDNMRITPSLRSQKGMIWSKYAINFDWWEAEIHFRVKGPGRLGADGLAFWYTKTPGVLGQVFGSSDKWDGLGLFFDSYDNDGKNNNPYIMAVGNDGTRSFDHANDGSTQQLGGCMRDFRNKPYPVRARITFFQNILTVYFHNGRTNNDNDYEMCMRLENIHLPKMGYFGISAATGGLADDHDVMRFLVHSLRPFAPSDQSPDTSQDSKKIELEFEEYQKKLKQQKDQWVKEHPDQAKINVDEWENFFGESEKDLLQIFQGQSAIREVISNLHTKMDDVILRQEKCLALLSLLQNGGVAADGKVPTVLGDSIRRDEVNTIMANQREIVSTSRDIKNFVSDIQGKTGQLLSRGTGSAEPLGGAYDVHVTLKEMKDSLNMVKQDLHGTSQRMLKQQPVCPSGNCVSITVLSLLLGLHILILISYFIYKDSKETKAKKFY